MTVGELAPTRGSVDVPPHRYLAPDAGACRWGGENLDLDCATDALLCLDGKMFPEPHPGEAARTIGQRFRGTALAVELSRVEADEAG